MTCDENTCYWPTVEGPMFIYPMSPDPEAVTFFSIVEDKILAVVFGIINGSRLMYTYGVNGILYEWEFDNGLGEYLPKRVQFNLIYKAVLQMYIIRSEVLFIYTNQTNYEF